jgi:hypothetical protein
MSLQAWLWNGTWRKMHPERLVWFAKTNYSLFSTHGNTCTTFIVGVYLSKGIVLTLHTYFFWVLLGDDITWKMYPSSCYFVIHFRKKVALTLAECQGYCIQDNRCAMAQYQRPFCALTSDTTFRTFACEMESVLCVKGTSFEEVMHSFICL